MAIKCSSNNMQVAFSALTLLVGRQKGHPACKKIWEGWWRWALVSPDGVAPSRMVGVLIFPCTIKSRSSLLAPAHPGGPSKRAIKWLWCGVVVIICRFHYPAPTVKNWRILSEQRFTTHMRLLTVQGDSEANTVASSP